MKYSSTIFTQEDALFGWNFVDSSFSSGKPNGAPLAEVKKSALGHTMHSQFTLLIATLLLGICIGSAVKRSKGESEREANFSDTRASARPLGRRAMADLEPIPKNALQTDNSIKPTSTTAATIPQILSQLDSSLSSGEKILASCDAYEAIRWMSPGEIRYSMGQLAGDIEGEATKELRLLLMGLWARQDGESAFEYALKQDRSIQNQILATTYKVWTDSNLKAARRWYQDNRDRLIKEVNISLMIATIARYDIDFSFGEIELLSPSKQRSAIWLTTGYVVKDPDNRERFIDQMYSIDDKDLRDHSMRRLFAWWDMYDRVSLAPQIKKMKASGLLDPSYDYKKEILKD